MSALLKAGDALALAAVRALDAPRPHEELLVFQSASALVDMAAPDEPIVDERAELEAVIAELRDRLAAAEDSADAREDAAFERGRREGEDLATGETEKRLELLRKGVEAVHLAHAERMAEYELLALQLAQTALQRLFGDHDLRPALVERTIGRTLATTKRELVLGIKVSPRDFRSEDELQTLAGQFAGLEVAHDETLGAGDCRVDLRLGTIDLGLPGQWARLSALFEQLAGAELAP